MPHSSISNVMWACSVSTRLIVLQDFKHITHSHSLFSKVSNFVRKGIMFLFKSSWSPDKLSLFQSNLLRDETWSLAIKEIPRYMLDCGVSFFCFLVMFSLLRGANLIIQWSDWPQDMCSREKERYSSGKMEKIPCNNTQILAVMC